MTVVLKECSVYIYMFCALLVGKCLVPFYEVFWHFIYTSLCPNDNSLTLLYINSQSI